MWAVGQFFVIAILLQCTHGANVLNWLWGKSPDESTVIVADGVPLISIPYEARTDDEKFLQEAAKFTDIQVSSPLETCQHKVVMKIRTSCGDMSEEQLAKLSVNLLNCQSAVEGRKMFPCTEDMSLKQCTTDMDADVWNAYHLISNRARAVCYSARSTQFRALTELTVNKLMQSAHAQIQALGSLKESQERLEGQTLEALSSISEGNKALLQQQENLKDAQVTAHNLVAANLRDLNNEKALIRAGHAQLARMTEDIKERLEKSSSDIMNQAMEQQDTHQKTLADLMEIQDQAKLIWEKIESSTDRILAQNAAAASQYEKTLEKLMKINETIHFIWNVTESMRTEVDEKLGWITEYIGDTSEQFNRVYRSALHMIYLLAAMIVASFLHAPFSSRAAIMGIVPLNLMTFLKHGMDVCLDFTSITALIFMISGMHYLMVTVQYLCSPRQKSIDRDDYDGERVQKPHKNTNGFTNNNVQERSRTPEMKTINKPKLHVRTLAAVRELFAIIIQKIINFIDKTVLILQSAASWCRQNSTPMEEELSCSYLPARKTREDLVTDYAKEYPSLSEDGTDYENSPEIGFEKPRRVYENGVDAKDLRYRIGTRNHSPAESFGSHQSDSRSVTPYYGERRMLCAALTKSGSKCRSRATTGGLFCGRHRSGSSIMGD